MKIRRLPSGSYNTILYLGKDENGKQIRKSITGPDRMAVRRMMAEYQVNYAKRDDAPMLCDAIEMYIASRMDVISPYTERGYRNILKVLQRMPAARVACDSGTLAFQNIINQLHVDGKSPKTIRNYIGLIGPAVKAAGYSCGELTKPQPVKPDLYLPTEEMMKKVLEAAKGTELEIPIQLGMLGLRRGEVCAVTAQDIDKNVLHIRKAAVQINGIVSSKTPKTYDSDRYVLLPPSVARKIKKAGVATDLKPSLLSDRFFSFLKKNNFRHFRFHDLRAFFASYCHNVLHLSDAQIQRMGGWKTPHVMKRAYIKPMREDEAAKAAQSAFGDMMR